MRRRRAEEGIAACAIIHPFIQFNSINLHSFVFMCVCPPTLNSACVCVCVSPQTSLTIHYVPHLFGTLVKAVVIHLP